MSSPNEMIWLTTLTNRREQNIREYHYWFAQITLNNIQLQIVEKKIIVLHKLHDTKVSNL